MEAFAVALTKDAEGQEWTLFNATCLGVEPSSDLVRCRFTGSMMRIVMRFEAPDWAHAKTIFDWKSRLDRKVPKHLLSWEEAKLLVGHHVHPSQEAPRPGEVRLHREDPGGRAGPPVLAQGQEQQADGPRPKLRALRPAPASGDP
jgi:hypothetical protein